MATASRPNLVTDRAWVWGLPLVPLTRAAAADAVIDLVGAGGSSYFITANAHYAMLSDTIEELREVNQNAAFVLADGAPLVWASRWGKIPLPERVAGSDLIYDLSERAAAKGLGIFLLGGAPGVAEDAGRELERRFPGLRIVGAEAPPFRDLSPEEHDELADRIRRASPDLLFVAFGQPKGEFWIAQHLKSLGVPVGVQIGASLDFVAGRIPRAPRLLQKIGMEWAYRIWQEPSRLAPRYARNAWFILKMIVGGGRTATPRKSTQPIGADR